MPQIDLKELSQNINRHSVHWSAVNDALPNRPLILPNSSAVPGGLTQSGFVVFGNEVSSHFTHVVTADNAVEAAQSQRSVSRKILISTIKLFRKTVTALLPETNYLKQLPETPPIGANDRLFEDTGDDIANIWAAINADTTLDTTLPLVLSDGTSLAAFQSALATVKAANATLLAVKETARQARAARDEKVKAAIAAISSYRKTVRVHLPPGHPLLATLPTLS